jgi:hypothetical protein
MSGREGVGKYNAHPQEKLQNQLEKSTMPNHEGESSMQTWSPTIDLVYGRDDGREAQRI